MSTTDLPGSSLLANRYRLVERLGAGGMSVVWRGFDEVLGRQVAVKVLPPSSSADPSFRRRLRAEAQAAARLTHPNITNVYDYGEATTVDGEPVPYVVMELVDGESLAAVLARVRRLPWPAAVRICAEVSAALAAAHARGIVHRDVTPANVMLTPTGAKVVDFGISALIGENDIDPDGSLLGTPAYLAPERLEGGQVSPATDVYAVGLLIYRTLIGQLPWDVGTTTALLRAHQYTEPDPLPPVEGLPAEVADLVGQCLEKRPDDRPSSADLAQVLAGVSAGAPAARGYVPDWAESGEDTTILPSALSYTDGIGRVRPGHARVANSTPVQAGRGVASVRAAAEGPAGLAAAAAAMAAAAENAPVSPAPGTAIPVSVSDVKAAIAGEPVAGRQPVAAVSPAGPSAGPAPSSGAPAAAASAVPASAVPAPAAPSDAAPSDTDGSSRASSGRVAPTAPPPGNHAPGRNNRFGAVPPSAPAAGAAAAGGAAAGAAATPFVPADASATALRPAASGAPPQRGGGGGGGGTPPNRGGGAGPGGPTGPSRSQKTHTRRVMIVAATVLLLGAAAYGWSLAAGEAPTGQTVKSGALPQPSVIPPSGKCVVSYAVRADDGNRFDATVTVANRDQSTIKNWNLWFIMQGDQTVRGGGRDSFKLEQQNTAVTVKSREPLSAQKSVTMNISGRYAKSNAAPMVFQLGGQTCETYVSGKPGEPSRPVERLSNGQVRLGPPTTTPKPGLIIRNGVVVPVPVPSGSVTPTNSPTTTTTTTTPVVDCNAVPRPLECPPPKPDDTPPTTVPTTTPPTTEPTTEPPPTEDPTPDDTADTGADTTSTGADTSGGVNAPPP
ncbi:MAG TPA: serine/threonine-protein kinase [Actinoplanes sp.]|nr:serine/threonine-protein kinase [Actinoplanes sp.]